MTFPETNALISAVLSVFSVAIASILVFQPTIQTFVYPSSAVLAPTWALVLTNYHAGTVFADSVKSITGALLGAGFGVAAYALADVLPISGLDQHVIATVLAIPFAFTIAIGDPLVGSPLTPWFKADVAWLSLYIVTSFSKQDGYIAGRNAVISFSFGSVSAMLVVSSLRLMSELGSTKRRLKNSLNNFCAAQTHWVEGLTAFMASSSGDHSTELEIRRAAATKTLAEFQTMMSLAKVSDPWSVLRNPELTSDISVTCVLMHSLLLAFRETICPESYCEDSLRTTLAPIYDTFGRLRMAVVLATRPTTPVKARRVAHAQLKDEALNLYRVMLKNAATTASNRPADLPLGQHTMRIQSAMFSLIFYSLLVDHFLTKIDIALELYGPLKSMAVFWQDKWVRLFQVSAWKKVNNVKYAYRAVIAQQLVAQTALFIARVDPEKFGPYVLWCMLPVIFTFLGTVGGSVLKGTRRIVGTIIAGAIGCVTALANAGDASAFFLEMLIVCFCGKLFSFHPKIGYAGPVGAFSWIIMILPSVSVTDTGVLLTAVFYRMVLTVGGVIASSLLSAILFPSFSATAMRRAMSRTVATCAKLVSDGMKAVIAGTPFHDDGLETFSAIAAVTSFRGAGDSALRSLQKDLIALPTLCEQARAEIGFINNLCCISERPPGVRTLTDAETVLYRFIDSVLVLTAVAASARVSRKTHDAFFTEQVVHALQQFIDKVDLAGTKLASLLEGNEMVKLDDCYVSDKIDVVERNLMAVRRILGESRRLPDVIRGGSPLIYVCYFALSELAEFWDDFVRQLSGIPVAPPAAVEDGQIRKLNSRISRNDSSHSSLHIC
jgi:hypothetical protein